MMSPCYERETRSWVFIVTAPPRPKFLPAEKNLIYATGDQFRSVVGGVLVSTGGGESGSGAAPSGAKDPEAIKLTF